MQLSALYNIASADAHPIIDLDATIFLQLGIFTFMALVATKLLFKPYLAMRDKRDEGIRGARDEADRLSAEADAQLADYEDKLAAARSKAQAEQRKIRTEAAAHEQKVTSEARAEALARIETAKQKVASETEAARTELMPKADELANQIVDKLLAQGAR